MANLTYSNIFTNVHKWDEDYTYLGIFVTGKLNQYNGQNFYILDAIDIDWNGAFVEKLNSYVYSTEDLINLFNILEDQNTDIKNNYISKNEFTYVVSDTLDYLTYTIEENVFSHIINRYEVLNAISDILIDKTKYLEINYNDIVANNKFTQYGKSRDFFIYDENANVFRSITKEFILNNPNEKYYIFLLSDIIKLNKDVFNIYDIIGTEEYNYITNSYSYTGFYNRFDNINNNITYISYYLDNNTITTIEAYNYAYISYINSYTNSYLIGKHTQYNIYEKVDNLQSQEFLDYLTDHRNYVWVKDLETNTYISILYKGNPDYEYYMLHDKIDGYGISKEIEDIQNSIIDNSYLLYKLSISSKDTNLIATINPSNSNIDKTQNRTINLNLKNSIINPKTGSITEGIINHENMINGVSYLLGWNILK